MTTPIYRPYIKDEQTLIATMLSDFAVRFQTCIPAIVTEVISRDTVKVSPAVQQTNSAGQPVGWADITTTVLVPFGGSMFISMPVAVGDTGWLVASDLDTSIFKKEKRPAQQKAYTRHLYQYGFFVPDMINGYTVSDDDNGAVVLSSLDGKTKIAIADKSITIESDDQLKIKAKSVTIDSENSNVVIDGVNFKNHTHTVPTGISVQVDTTSGSGATTATVTTSGVDDV